MRDTFNDAEATTLLVGLILSTIIFVFTHSLELAHSDTPLPPPYPHTTSRRRRRAFTAYDKFLLKLVAFATVEIVGLLTQNHKPLTPRLALTWVPAFFSIAALVTAAWGGNEGQVQLGLG